MKRSINFLRELFSDWSDNDAPMLGAALAFYAVLSLSPLLVLALSVAGLLSERAAVVPRIAQQIEGLVGPASAQAINMALSGAQHNQKQGIIASIVSFVILLFSASAVFGALRDSLHRIFDVKAEKTSGIGALIRGEFLSLGMVFFVAFFLLASLLFSAVAEAAGTNPPARIAAAAISIVCVAGAFALMFRYVPATRVPWKAAGYGGLLTSILFTAGKYATGLYFAEAAVGSSYGPAGSLVVILVWVYYMAQIVFFGAEFTHAIARNSIGPGTAQAGPRSTIMKDSTKDQIQGKAREVKGSVKEKIGRATNKRRLEDAGQDEKAGGTLQKKLGQVEKVLGA